MTLAHLRRTLLGLACLWLFAPALAVTPLVSPDAAVLDIDDVGLYSVGWAYRGKPAVIMPDGWTGHFVEPMGISCAPAGEQRGKRAHLLHCPWRGGTGVTWQEYRFALPKCRGAVVSGFVAMRSDMVGKTDGATFRVSVDGRVAWEANTKDDAWVPFRIRLSDGRPRTVTVRFEVDPGPKDDSSFDYAYWGGRKLTMAGIAVAQRPRPAPRPLALARLLSSATRSVAPTSGFAGRSTAVWKGGKALFTYQGPDGSLTYEVAPPARPTDPLLGQAHVVAHMAGDRLERVPLARAAEVRFTTAATPTAVRSTMAGGILRIVRTYRVGDREATVRLTVAMSQKSLVVDAACDQPVVSEVDMGTWGPVMRRRAVPTPFYSGEIHYLPSQNAFVGAFLDWTASNASLHQGQLARYDALTDGTRNPLKERAVFTAAWHYAEVMPNPGNAPSPYRRTLADKIILDTWGPDFSRMARMLERLHGLGVRNAVVLVHVWQRDGYDNGLPAHVPAMAGMGGDPAMKDLVGTAVRLGYLVALHENYVDYYPNYEGFNAHDIALDSAGKQQLAWYNAGTRIQSYAIQPNAILPLARSQSPQVKGRFGTNANYLDVHSAVPPWFHVDQRAGEQGAGTFRRVWEVHRDLWQFERDTHGGPVFGEGNNHWYWSGLLDGVEAQFGVGWPGNGGQTAPLAVDFDLLKIHPLQFNHGMGYYERWWTDMQWGSVPPMTLLDQYRLQEVLYGHAGFLGAATWGIDRLSWLEHHLVSPVSAQFGASVPTGIAYLEGGRWVDGTAAAKSGRRTVARVRYASGLQVVGNTSDKPVSVGGLTLPQYGWLATGKGLTAWTAQRDGGMADYVETPTSVFANARPRSQWSLSGQSLIRPTVASFAQIGPRQFRATYRWKADEAPPGLYHCFVHFGRTGPNGDEGIKFQQDHGLTPATDQWKPGQVVTDGPHDVTVPSGIEDGDYQWTIGLVDAVGGGGRLRLQGPTDASGRILLGVIRVAQGGAIVEFVRETGKDPRLAVAYGAGLNAPGRLVDFGNARTDGAFHLARRGGDWVLTPCPGVTGTRVDLKAGKFGDPTQAVAGDPSDAAPPQVSRSGGWITLRLGSASTYRWPAKAP